MSSLSDKQERHYPTGWDKPPFISNSLLRWGIILGAIIYLIAAIASMEINPQRLMEGIPRGQRFIASFFPPNFADNRGVVWDGILESIWMAIISMSLQPIAKFSHSVKSVQCVVIPLVTKNFTTVVIVN